MEAQAAANLTPDRRQRKAPSTLYKLYTWGVILLGAATALLAVLSLPDDRTGLLLFGLMAGAAQLGDVELFASSRSRISVSNVLAIASILLFGPMAGSLTHLVSGLMTVITTTLRSNAPESGRASWFERSAFNTSMLVISAGLAGWVYVLMGGTVGQVSQPGNIVPLICAASVETLCNLVILLWVIALQTGRRPVDIWRQDFSWGVPINILGSILGGGSLAMAYQMQSLLGVLVFLLPVLAISYSFRLYVSRTKTYVNELEETRFSQYQLIDDLLGTLSAMIDADDQYTYNHTWFVVKYARALAEELGLPPEEVETIRRAAMVHDIGKIGVPDDIIGKSSPLSDEEYNRVKRHPVIGGEIIGRMRGFQALVPLVRNHHERWDGSGYPDGLKGDEIPMGARVIALADAFEAMLTDRPYRRTKSFNETVAEIVRCSETQFDPQVVDGFLRMIEKKDRGFFVNSAILVDRAWLLSGGDAEATYGRYLKKSMGE